MGAIGYRAAAAREGGERVSGGKLVAGRKRDDKIAMTSRRWGSDSDQTTVRYLRERHDGALDLARIAHVHWTQLHPQRLRHRLDDCVLTGPGAHSGVPKDRRPRHAGPDLFKQLQPFSAEAILEQGKSRGVAARTRQTFDEPGANRVNDTHEHNRHRSGRLLERSHRGAR